MKFRWWAAALLVAALLPLSLGWPSIRNGRRWRRSPQKRVVTRAMPGADYRGRSTAHVSARRAVRHTAANSAPAAGASCAATEKGLSDARLPTSRRRRISRSDGRIACDGPTRAAHLAPAAVDLQWPAR